MYDAYTDYFQGAVYIYTPRSQYDWTQIQVLTPPAETLEIARTMVNTQMNFGVAVDIDELSDTIVVGANAYSKCFFIRTLLYINVLSVL